MSQQLWTITNTTTGEVLAPSFSTPSAGSHPKDNGWPWDATAQKATKIAVLPGPMQVWSGTGWVEDAAKVEAMLVGQIKTEAERRKMMVRSPGSGKSAEYRQKKTEAVASVNVTAAILNALTAVDAAKQYPSAWLEAKLTGDKLDVVLNRYRVASTAADAEIYRLSAIEQAGVKAIKAAATAQAKQAAYAAIDWTWTA